MIQVAIAFPFEFIGIKNICLWFSTSSADVPSFGHNFCVDGYADCTDDSQEYHSRREYVHA